MESIAPENLSKLNSSHRAALLTVAVQVVFVLVLCALATRPFLTFESGPDSQTVTTLWTAVLFLAVGSLLLRRLFNGWERIKTAGLLGGVDGVLRNLHINSAITCGLGTVAAVVGFVIAQMTGDYFEMMRAAGVSFIVFIANLPRKKNWKTIVKRVQEL